MRHEVNCRIVFDSIHLLEVEMPGGFVQVAGFNPFANHDLMKLFTKVEGPNKNLFRYDNQGETWHVAYTAQIDRTILDRYLPVSWEWHAHINHLFALNNDFGFYLEHMIKRTPEIEKALEHFNAMVKTLVEITLNKAPVKRWDQITEEEIKKAYDNFIAGVCEIDEAQIANRILNTFLTNRSALNDLEKKCLEGWYEDWYNKQKSTG
ncbi:hypothetical protein [Paenibacillus taichungensis]